MANVLIDSKKYNCIGPYLYKAIKPISINIITWMFDKSHRGQNIIVANANDQKHASILYLSTGSEGESKLIDLYDSLKLTDDSIGIVEGLPESSSISELYE